MFSPFCKTQVKQEDKTGTSSTNSISQSVKEKMNNLFTHQDKVAAHSHKHRLPFNLPLSLQPFYPPNLSPLPLHPTQLVMNQNSLNFNMYGNHYSDVKSIRPPKDYLNYSQLNTSNLNQLNLINEMMKSYSGVTAAIHIKSLMSLMNSFPLFPNFDGLKTPLLSHESSKKLSRKPNVQAYSKMSLGPATSKLNDTLHYKPNKTRDPPKSDDTQKTKQDTIIKPVVMRGITKPKTHMCPYCGKFYSRKYGLKIHIRTHTGYKPLKCKICGRAFGDPSNLNKHVRLHAKGKTPYKCGVCGKVLVRKRDLDRHMMSRHSLPNKSSKDGCHSSCESHHEDSGCCC